MCLGDISDVNKRFCLVCAFFFFIVISSYLLAGGLTEYPCLADFFFSLSFPQRV